MRYGTRLMFCMLSLPLAACHQGQVGAQTNSPLGKYADIEGTWCEGKIVWDPATIPSIGCFGLHAGGSASGDIVGTATKVEFRKGSGPADSRIAYFADGSLVTSVDNKRTNHPHVLVGSSGYVFCSADPRANEGGCPVRIDDLKATGDGFIFQVDRKVRPNVYVGSQANYDAEMRRGRP